MHISDYQSRLLSLINIVIGGGVVGVSAALALARRKCNVTLIEQFDLGHFRGSSHGGSRIIRYLYDKPHYPGG